MAKSMNKIKAGLKLKTASRDGALSLKLGIKKHTLPYEVRLLQSENYVFVHVPPAAEVMKITKEGLVVVTDPTEAEAAVNEFKKSRRRKRGANKTSAEVPDELKAALAKIPAGHKLVIGPDGQPRLAKTRKRMKKA